MSLFGSTLMISKEVETVVKQVADLGFERGGA